MAPILVTGATGFIGSHLVETLQAAGYEVRAMAHYRSSPDLGNLTADCEVVRGDIRDERFVDDAVAGCELVIHLAALVDVGLSFRTPRSYLDTNVGGCLNILEGCRKHSVPLITTSSSEVYGTAVQTPMDENHPLRPRSPYAASKLASDNLARSYHLGFGIPVVILRPFNTYGPRQSDRAIIPSIIKQLGQEVHVGNLESQRDWLYVSDSCAAYLAAIRFMDVLNGGVFNIGTGISYTVRTLLSMLGATHIIQDKERFRSGKSEVDRLECDFSRMYARTGWEPKVSLEEGLEKTKEWFLARQS
jgi:nucleoside-diphosphate-sugar epimerase